MLRDAFTLTWEPARILSRQYPLEGSGCGPSSDNYALVRLSRHTIRNCPRYWSLNMQPFKPQTAGQTTHDAEHGHETRDVNPVGVYAFLLFLTIGGAILFILLGGVYKFANQYAEKQDQKMQQSSPWLKQQADEERKDLQQMTEAYHAIGLNPTSKDVSQRESEIRVARIRE